MPVEFAKEALHKYVKSLFLMVGACCRVGASLGFAVVADALVEPHPLKKLETMRGKSIEVRGLALETQYVHQLQAFGTTLDYAHRVGLALPGPVAHVVGRAVAGIYAYGIIQKWSSRSGFGKSVVRDFHKLKV